MPKVRSTFEVAGVLDGFADTPLHIKLAVAKGALLVGVVSQVGSPPNATSEIVLVNGKVCPDLFESAEAHAVYSCKFSLVKFDAENATIIDCAARVSEPGGLVGRWNEQGSLGKKGICDHAFEMKSAIHAASNSSSATLSTTEAGGDYHAVSIASAVGDEEKGNTIPVASEVGASTTAAATSEPRELLLRGDAVDQDGNTYTTSLEATLHADGSVTGVSTPLSTEPDERCSLVGTWSGNDVSYTLEYSVNKISKLYRFCGVLVRDAFGTETLSGLWKYERWSMSEPSVSGSFSFSTVQRSALAEEPMLPGEYVFLGAATSDRGTTYKSTLTLRLAANGTLTGTSQEHSIVPQTCTLHGSWDQEQRTTTYHMSYTNGATASYEYVGKLQQQQLTGRWVNPRATTCESERGTFTFTVSSFSPTAMLVVGAEAAASEKTVS
jgi:hypothetical protein